VGKDRVKYLVAAIGLLWPSWRQGIYVDLGANEGNTVAEFLRRHPRWRVYAFEPTPRLAADLRTRFRQNPNVNIIEAAASNADGSATFYPGIDSNQSSTLVTGKADIPSWRVNYSAGYSVRTVDFAAWLDRHTAGNDRLIVKMDIEGSEYPVLDRLLQTGVIDRIQELRVEWHKDRFPAPEHDRIYKAVKRQVGKLVNWN